MNRTSPAIDLKARLLRIASVMRSSGAGPLIVASDVVAIAAEWETAGHREQSGGKDANSAIREALYYRLAWFEARDRAVTELGQDIRNWMTHDLAIWILSEVPEAQRREVKEKLLFRFAPQRKRQHLVTKPQGIRAVKSILAIPTVARSKECEECRKWKAILVEHGIDVK